ncbi:hypothetical protein [Amycolatopsis sp.]|uniref:aromatic-ring hydroxylase C-terminal domain-containing protein n=1 Tax=Amycolatopsis sp. TaxID=37632 RepID=UPI00345AA61A
MGRPVRHPRAAPLAARCRFVYIGLVRPGGAALVRPDGIIAWRTSAVPEDPRSVLADVLAQLVSRPALVSA